MRGGVVMVAAARSGRGPAIHERPGGPAAGDGGPGRGRDRPPGGRSAKTGRPAAGRRRRQRGFRAATVPWFQRYYYYAINGITDDAGWHVTQALPQWIEITLPREQPIGRVVLYTPNLGAVQLPVPRRQWRNAHRRGQEPVRPGRRDRAPLPPRDSHPEAPRVVARRHRETPGIRRRWSARSRPTRTRRRPGHAHPRVDSPAAAPDLRPIFADANRSATLWSDEFRPFRQSPLRAFRRRLGTEPRRLRRHARRRPGDLHLAGEAGLCVDESHTCPTTRPIGSTRFASVESRATVTASSRAASASRRASSRCVAP